MRTIHVEIEIPRLLMHNEQTADPLNEYAKAMKAITSKRQKTDEDHLELAKIEFQAGLYHDEKLGPYIPASWITGTMVEGAKRNRLGREFSAFVIVADDQIPLQYVGPRKREELWACKQFIDRRSVCVMTSRTMRTRPRFDRCGAAFTLNVFEGGPVDADILTALSIAGRAIGIGDGRPQLAGRFTIKSFKSIG